MTHVEAVLKHHKIHVPWSQSSLRLSVVLTDIPRHLWTRDVGILPVKQVEVDSR